MGEWSTPAERRRMLAEHREGLSFGRISRKWGWSRSGVFLMIQTAKAEERRERQRAQPEAPRRGRATGGVLARISRLR